LLAAWIEDLFAEAPVGAGWRPRRTLAHRGPRRPTLAGFVPICTRYTLADLTPKYPLPHFSKLCAAFHVLLITRSKTKTSSPGWICPTQACTKPRCTAYMLRVRVHVKKTHDARENNSRTGVCTSCARWPRAENRCFARRAHSSRGARRSLFEPARLICALRLPGEVGVPRLPARAPEAALLLDGRVAGTR